VEFRCSQKTVTHLRAVVLVEPREQNEEELTGELRTTVWGIEEEERGKQKTHGLRRGKIKRKQRYVFIICA
jgi:hypothetical protein